MKWLLLLLLSLFACQLHPVAPQQPDSFWCLARWTECSGDYCPFDSYFKLGNNQCVTSRGTCEEAKTDYLQFWHDRQGEGGWYYYGECQYDYFVYCFQGPTPGDPEYCWSSFYSCNVERSNNYIFSECYLRNTP